MSSIAEDRPYTKAIANVPLQSVTGVFYRAVPQPVADYALEDGPSYTYQNRYNVAQQFGALYFGDRAEVCISTLEKRGLLSARRVPHMLLSFEIQADHVLDLTDPDVWKLMGLIRDKLVAPRGVPMAFETTHAIATAAYHSGHICGLLTPDATETGNALVLYPARLLARDFIRVKDQVAF